MVTVEFSVEAFQKLVDEIMVQPGLDCGLDGLDKESLRVYGIWNKLAGLQEFFKELPSMPIEIRSILSEAMSTVSAMQAMNADRREAALNNRAP